MNVRMVRWSAMVVALGILGCSSQGGSATPIVTQKSIQEIQTDWGSPGTPVDGGDAQSNPSGSPAKP